MFYSSEIRDIVLIGLQSYIFKLMDVISGINGIVTLIQLALKS
jgi:hypothetical protein